MLAEETGTPSGFLEEGERWPCLVAICPKRGGPDAALDVAMRRYADGDDAAFREVYAPLAPQLLGFARRWSRSSAMAEDAVQQTFFLVHRARGSFERGAATSPWVFAILRRVLIDANRRERRAAAQAESSVDRHALHLGSRPDEDYRARELADRLTREHDKLSPRQQEAFAMVRTAGLSFGEAAATLGSTSAAVKLRLHRATRALRRVVEVELRTLHSACGKDSPRISP